MIIIYFFSLFLSFLILSVNGLRIAVFGGSGFVGRRVCQGLIQLNHEVISISTSGQSRLLYENAPWIEQVDWIQANVMNDNAENKLEQKLGSLDAAISCVGNVQPVKEWKQLFGLAFNDDQLRFENGDTNEKICQLAKNAGAKRFVFLSVSYEVAKALEGPIEGYLDGKRQAEHAASELFGNDNTIVLGPSLIYGGLRFPALGKLYRAFVESFPAKAYVKSNTMLRNLSSTPNNEDWVEAMIFSPPVDVEIVAQVVCAAAIGVINRAIVAGDRRQGFYGLDGKPVFYDNVLFIDGTSSIERVADALIIQKLLPDTLTFDTPTKNSYPKYEGALIGKAPFLKPIPVAAVFIIIFWAISTQQFVSVVSSST